MRWCFMLVFAIGCSDGISGTRRYPDAPSDIDAPNIDAVPPCATQIPIAATEVKGIAVNGTELVVSLLNNSMFQLQVLDVSGGTPTTIATQSEAIEVATRGGVAFYALKQTDGYEVHQRAGADDTVLGSVSTSGPVELGASATDVYVLAPDMTVTRLWRIARTGGAAVEVTNTAPGSGLRVGDTIAAYNSFAAGGIQVVTLPGPAQPTVHMPPGGGPSLVGDAGFTFSAGMISQNTKWYAVNQFLPTSGTLVTEQVYMAPLPAVFTDDRFVYVGNWQYRIVPGQLAMKEAASYCFVPFAYDDTKHYGVSENNGTFSLTIAPRPL